MTTSFFSDQVDQELSLDDMKSVNGGLLGMGFAAVGIVIATTMKDLLEGEELGTSLNEVIDDVVGGGGGDVTSGDVNVVHK
jgi:hypothetical protein